MRLLPPADKLGFDGEVEAVGLVFDGLKGAQGKCAGVGLSLPVRGTLGGLLDGEQGFAGEMERELAEGEEGERAVDGSNERGVLGVDRFETGGHVEFNLDAVAVFPGALEAEKLAGGRTEA